MRLKKIREEKGFSQKQIAEILQIKQNTYSQYETGTRQIPIESLIILAKFFDVSVDYILGITEVDIPYPKN